MVIILNVGIVLIRSGLIVTTYILISAHCLKTCAYCLLNMCKVLELSVGTGAMKRKWWKLGKRRSHLDGLQGKPIK